MPGHDIIVVGASAGGVEVLLDLASELPADFPASVFVVVHTPAGYASALPELLSARGAMPAVHPLHGDDIVPGRIYVAPPDSHLLVRPGWVEVIRSAKENGHRPAVDPLFRSASWSYGSRVVAVVLSGHQDCGTAGMMSVKARGGVLVVQDPATAAAPEMPRSALRSLEVDHVVHPLELPGLLARLAAEPAPAAAPAPADPALDALEGRRLGDPADVVCPICQGAMTEAQAGTLQHFRCHVGHAFTIDALAREQGEHVERALWAAARSLEESSSLARRMGSRTADGDLRRRFAEKAATLGRQAEVIRKLLLEGAAVPKAEPPERTEAAAAEHRGNGDGSRA